MDSNGEFVCACSSKSIHVFGQFQKDNHLIINPLGHPLSCKFDHNLLYVVTKNNILSIYEINKNISTKEKDYQPIFKTFLEGVIRPMEINESFLPKKN